MIESTHFPGRRKLTPSVREHPVRCQSTARCTRIVIATAPPANAAAATPSSSVLLTTLHGGPGTPAAWLIRIESSRLSFRGTTSGNHGTTTPRLSATAEADIASTWTAGLEQPADWKAASGHTRNPTSPTGRGDGPTNERQADGATIPLGGPGYDAFLKASECRAYTAELACNGRLLDAARAIASKR